MNIPMPQCQIGGAESGVEAFARDMWLHYYRILTVNVHRKSLTDPHECSDVQTLFRVVRSRICHNT